MKQFLCLLFVFNGLIVFSQEDRLPFIPEIIKQFHNVRDVAISPNGDEVLFTVQNMSGTISNILQVTKNKNGWGTPTIASFSGMYFDLEPFFSHDGLKLYYASKRPLDHTDAKEKDFDIWYVERTNAQSSWSEPKNLGDSINSMYDEFYPSLAINGNLYFTRDNPNLNNKDDIYMSAFKNGNYTTPVALPNTINSTGYEYNAFIAPNESFIVFGAYNRPDGFGSGDLYISFKTEDGWLPAKNLGNTINTTKMDYCPFVDLKTNTLYFTSKVDNSKISLDRPLTTKELRTELNRYDNGLSRLYQVNINQILKNTVTD